MEFTLGEESDETNQKKPMSGEELSKHLDRLIQDKANNQRIRDWVEVCVCGCVCGVMCVHMQLCVSAGQLKV